MEIQALSNTRNAPQGANTGTADDQKFLQLLEELDTYLESQRKTEHEKRAEEEARLAKRIKDRKIAELKARISTLRSKVNMGYADAERELSGLETQLFHLLLFG